MKERTEKLSVWDSLKNSKKPVVLYGMGDGADKILDLCAEKNIKISGVFASDGFARGNVFRGFKVKKLSETEEEFGDFCILLAFATRDAEVTKKIYELDGKYELYAPSFPVCGGGYPDYGFFAGNISDVKKARALLSDAISGETYINAINFMISGKLKYLKTIRTPKACAIGLLGLDGDGDMHYADVGAYDGDTILEMSKYANDRGISIKKITAFEPDKKNFAKLEKNMLESGLSGICELHNLGAWSEKTTLRFAAKSGRNSSLAAADAKKTTEIFADRVDNIPDCPTLIKYDAEGAEYEALAGTERFIQKYSPKLIVSLYHRSEDIFKLMLYINGINPGYDFYIRNHKYIPCWDLNLYAVPGKKW